MKHTTAADVGQRIYIRRKQLAITQEQLAELAGATPQAISNYERGERELKASTAVKIADALHISCDWLLTGREADTPIARFTELTPEKKKIAEEILELCARLGK